MNRLSDRVDEPNLDPNILSVLRYSFASLYNSRCPAPEDKAEMDKQTRLFIESQTDDPRKRLLYMREYRVFTGRKRKEHDTTVFLTPVN